MKKIKLLPILIIVNVIFIISRIINNNYTEDFNKIAKIKIEFIFLNEKNIENILYDMKNLKNYYNFKENFIKNKHITCKYFESNKNKSIVVATIKNQQLEKLCD